MGSVGKSIQRVDAVAKAKGSAQYTDDIFIKDALVVKVFRSTIANGWVKKIDTGKAKALPGVEAVVTFKDVPANKYPIAGHPWSVDPSHQDIQDKNILSGRVRYYGEEIAAVVAVNEIVAEKALDLIEVEYQSYEPILTTAAALKEGAVEVHEGTKNIIKESEYIVGDLEKAYAEADEVFEDEFKTSMMQHGHIENHIAYAYVDDNDRVVVVTPNQCGFTCQRVIGQALGIPSGKVRVIKPYVGGSFGSKQDVVAEVLVAFLTLKVGGRPVKLEYSREETFISRVRHPFEMKIKTAVKKDGTILARELDIISNNGAYASHGHAVAETAMASFRHLYNQKALRTKASTLYTNMPTAGAMRGYGVPQVKFALESQLEDIARTLKIDPIEFRIKNLNGEDYIDPISNVHFYSNKLVDCIEKGKKLIKWEEKKAEYKNQTGSKRRGLGMACFCYQSNTHPAQLEIAGARIIMNQDGSVQLQVGATEIGQGSDTGFVQIAADAIGISEDRVYLITTQDTDITPFDTGAYASRQTYVTGMAVRKTAEEIKRKIISYAEVMTDIPAHNLDVVDNNIVYKHNGKVVMTLEKLALDSHYNQLTAAPITAELTNRVRTNANSYGCTFVELEVDIPIGKVEILEIYNVHDAGTVINPEIVKGQIHGGVSMGIGYGLSEQLLFDEKTGKPLNNNLLDYKMATTLDVPAVGAEYVESFEPTSSNGNKCIGEPTLISQAPAIRNAILDATDVKFYQIPITPELMIEKFKGEGLI